MICLLNTDFHQAVVLLLFAVDADIPISDIMRYLMYAQFYGDSESAARGFRRIPENVRKRLLELDYSRAEHRCPQNMPIARLMKQASKFC